MSNPSADAQLELCCRTGSLDGIMEALNDGADVNCNGHSPLFIAVMANDREVVSALVNNEADVSLFEIKSTDKEEIVEALMALAPAPAVETDDTEKDVVDAKLIRAFDRMIRSNGLGAPVTRNRTAEYAAFAEGLKWIAAEDCEAVVAEFMTLIDTARGDEGGELPASFLEENGTRIVELSESYTSSEEIPGDLLKEYIKEQKKLKKA
ncbi:MAG: hypothetical protein ACI9R3_002406 [Verrucomicrobiales bacterium]|jgi:hypothetical protein